MNSKSSDSMIELNNKTRTKVAEGQLKRVAERFYRRYRIGGRALSIALVGDATIRRLNRDFLGHDRVTDVLAFPGEGDFFGEIIIDLAQVNRQANRYGHKFNAELMFVLVHGLLHLAGYTDNTDKDRGKMDRLTETFIGSL